MRIKPIVAVAVLACSAWVVGCQDNDMKSAGRVTGPDVDRDYQASHFNGMVNSDGAQDGRSDPSIRPSAQSATGTPTPTPGGQSLNSTNHPNGTTVRNGDSTGSGTMGN